MVNVVMTNYKIRERNLTREYTLTRNKIASSHILVEK